MSGDSSSDTTHKRQQKGKALQPPKHQKENREKSAAVNWGPLAAILVTIATYLLSQMLVGVLFGSIFGVLDWTERQVTDWLNTTLGQFVVIAASATVTLMVLWIFLEVKRASIRTLGFSRLPKWGDGTNILVGYVVYFAFFIVAAIVAGQILGVNTEQEQEIGFEGAKAVGGAQLALVFVSLVVLPPIVEETLFRGFLFGGLRTKLTLPWAAVITSVLFAAPHLMASSTGLLWIAAIDTFVLSLVLCYVRERTGALWACIGIHAFKNSLAFLYLFVVQ